MGRIQEIINQAIKTGYLTPQAEQQLNKLLATQTDPQDLTAFMVLQHAFISGRVRQACGQITCCQSKKLKNNPT